MSTALEGLKSVRKTFNLYASAFGVLALSECIRLLAVAFRFEEPPPQVLGYVVRIEYLSSVVGLLFGVFLIVLLLQCQITSVTLHRELKVSGQACPAIKRGIRLFPWIASPFHPKKLGGWLFWLLLVLGCTLVVRLAKAHLVGTVQTENPSLFRAQGYLLAGVFAVSLALLWRIEKSVCATSNLVTGQAVDRRSRLFARWGVVLSLVIAILVPTAARKPVFPVDLVQPNLSRPFHVRVAAEGGETFLYRDCRIIGRAGADRRASKSVSDLLRGYLVLETSEGQRIYVANAKIVGFEETALGDAEGN